MSVLTRPLEVQLWIVALLALSVVILLVLLWSAQRGRDVRLSIADIDNLREALPSIAGATHATLIDGNALEILQNGDGFWPRLLADIAAARETIHLESYVWWQGRICEEVAAALAAKAREGLEVRLLLDASGSAKMDSKLAELMREAGVKLNRYRPFSIANLGRINGRDHRKLAVIDGRLAYVFGHGIAQEWTGNAQDEEHWRDTGARITGPIVNVLQGVFAENWIEACGEVIVGLEYFPHLEPTGDVRMHAAYLFQHGTVSSVELLHRIAFAAAQHELWIQNPYMAADPPVMDALVAAAQRGVDVRVMLPGDVTDSQIVRHAGHAKFRKLMAGGVRLFEYQPTLNHQKVMIIDGFWSHIGSTNLDDRSFESNEELSLGIVDEATAQELREAFLDDLRHCEEMKLADWGRRGLRHRLLDRGAYLFNELL